MMKIEYYKKLAIIYNSNKLKKEKPYGHLNICQNEKKNHPV